MSSGNSSVSFLSPSNPLSPLLIFRETSQNKPFFMAAILLFSTRKKLRMRISDVVEIALVSTASHKVQESTARLPADVHQHSWSSRQSGGKKTKTEQLFWQLHRKTGPELFLFVPIQLTHVGVDEGN